MSEGGGDGGDVEVKSLAPQDNTGAGNQLHALLASSGGKSLFYRVDSRLSAFRTVLPGMEHWLPHP